MPMNYFHWHFLNLKNRKSMKKTSPIKYLIDLIPYQVFVIVLQCFVQIFVMILPVCMGKIVDYLTINYHLFVFILLGIILVTNFLSEYFNFLYKKLSIKVLYTFDAAFKTKIMHCIQSLQISVYEKNAHGYWMSKIERDAFSIYLCLADILEVVIPGFILFLYLVILCTCKNPILLFILIPAIMINIFLCKYFANAFAISAEKRRIMNEKEYTYLLNIFSMMTVLKSFNVLEIYKKKVDFIISRMARRNIDFQSKSNVFLASISGNLAIFGVVILGICIYLHYKNGISIGDIIIYQTLIMKCLDSSSKIIYLYPHFQNAKDSYKSIVPILFDENNKCIKSSYNIPKIKGEISFSDVSFSYEKEKPLLKDINFKIKANEYVVFLGKNASGKSTLSKLILGYFEQNKGSIYIDKWLPTEIQTQEKYCHIGIVPQKIMVYEDSLLENIRLYDKKISEKEVIDLLEKCKLTQLTDNKNIHSVISNNSLSGGQLQVLGIARALIKNPEILIFDEITNNLDIVTKKNILKIILSEKGQRTLISITHDIEYINYADRVFIITNNNVKEFDNTKNKENLIKSIMY